MCKPPRQSSGVFNSVFIFNNHQALEIGGNPVFLGTLLLSSEGHMNLFSLLIDLSVCNCCDYLDLFFNDSYSISFGIWMQVVGPISVFCATLQFDR